MGRLIGIAGDYWDKNGELAGRKTRESVRLIRSFIRMMEKRRGAIAPVSVHRVLFSPLCFLRETILREDKRRHRHVTNISPNILPSTILHSEHQLLHLVVTTMDLSSGWSKATHKNPKTGETTCYYFNKEGLTSHIPPPPADHDDESSLDDDGGDSLTENIDKKIGAS